MRIIPSLKSLFIFAAGFVSGLAFVGAWLFLAYFGFIRPKIDEENRAMNQFARHYAPELNLIRKPQPAFFDFTAVGRDGQALDFREYRGRVVVLNVWATWCSPCMAELPSLGELAAHYAADKDVAVVCVTEELAKTVFRNQEALASGAPLYSLEGKPISEAFDVGNGIPVTFVINPQGFIVSRHHGSANWAHSKVINFIDSLRKRPAPSLGQ